MTQDEIIEMAWQANLDREPPDDYCRVEYWTATFEDLEAYTKLVAEKVLADHIADVSKMIAAEREACAKEVESWVHICEDVEFLADKIRARGQA